LGGTLYLKRKGKGVEPCHSFNPTNTNTRGELVAIPVFGIAVAVMVEA